MPRIPGPPGGPVSGRPVVTRAEIGLSYDGPI